MGKDTAINWCRHTFNAWVGCQHKSEACRFCYAEAWATRFGQVGWGPGAARKRTAPANWKQPAKWDREARAAGEVHTVFCNSLSDVFDDHPSILDEWRSDLRELWRTTRNLHWLPLTKRPENWLRFLPPDPLSNVTLGVTIEDVRRLGETLPHIARIVELGWRPPFVSYEPALEAIDWEPALKHRLVSCIISGGGSGQDKRPHHPDWHRATRDACAKWGVAYNFKQWGNWASVSEVEGRGEQRFHTFPDGATIRWIGDSGKAERTLDGRTHDGMPGGSSR